MSLVWKALSKSYGGRPVLGGVSGSLPAGGCLAIMGPSGGGKTTLLRLLMGLEKPDSGEITGAEGLRFAPVFQENRLCEGLSALQNVALVLPKQRVDEIAPALAAVGFAGDDLHKPAAQLSGGQKRRVALVRALLADADIVVLDEAFKGLDDETRALCYAYVQKRLCARALLVVTHNTAEAGALCGGNVLYVPAVAAAKEQGID